MIESHTSLILSSSMTIITFNGSLTESNQFIYELMTSLLCIGQFIAVLQKVSMKFLCVKKWVDVAKKGKMLLFACMVK